MTSSPLKIQVVSIQLSKRLKELGVPQESEFHWYHNKKRNDWEPLSNGDWNYLREVGADIYYHAESRIPAFLVCELGEMFKKAGSELTIKAYGDLHGFKGTGAVGSIGVLWLLTEPDRLAKMLIYLLENNLIKASDL